MERNPASEIVRTGSIAFFVVVAAAIGYHGWGFAIGRRLLFSHDLGLSDVWHLHMPLKRFLADSLRLGELPFWCPEIGTGFPLLAEGQIGALYPPNLLLYGLLPLPLAFNWNLLLHIALAGAFAALLARETGACRAGSLLAGIVFAFCGFLTTHAKHVNLTAAAAWSPLILFLVSRHVRSRSVRSAVGIALAVAATVLCGHPQIAYYNLLMAWFFAAALLARRRGPETVKRRLGAAASLGGAMLAGLLLGAPQLLPTLELHRLGPRGEGLTWEQATEWSYHPAYLATFLSPKLFGDPGELRPAAGSDLVGFEPVAGGRNFFWEITGYVGLLPIALAGVGLRLGWRGNRPGPLLVLLVAGLLLTLGSYGGLARVFFAVLPGFDGFRFHARFLLYVDLALAVLAGSGWSLLSARIPRRGLALAATGIVASACFADLAAALGDQNPKIEAERWLDPPASVERIRALEASRGEPFRVSTYDPRRFVFGNAYFLARGWKGDLSPYDRAKEMLDPDLNLLYGIANFEFYHQIFPRWMGAAVESSRVRAAGADAGLDPKWISLFNVRYVLTPHPLLAERLPVLAKIPGDRVHGGGPDVRYEIHLLANPGVLPRAFLVPAATVVRNQGERAGPLSSGEFAMLRRMSDPSFDPLREVVVLAGAGDDPPAGEPGEPVGSRVRFLAYESRRVVLETEASRDCWLFSSDTHYPGWRAEIDGESVRVYPANLGGRAVRVPAGSHRVVFRYVPRSFQIGLLAAGVGLLGIGGAVWIGRRGRSGAPAPPGVQFR